MLFIKANCIVSKPISNNACYDFIIEKNNKLYRTQVKTTKSIKDGKMEFATKTTNYVKGNWVSLAYDKKEIDLFFLYCIENNWSGLYFPEDTIPKSLTIRIEKPKNNQVKGIRLIEDYTFEKQIDKI